MAEIPTSLFAKGLDAVCSKWLKNTAPADERVIRRELALQFLDAAETLILSPRVTFKVYGENVVLPLLTKRFGYAGVQKLLEEGALEFVLWRPLVTYTDEASLLAQGIHPLQSGDLNSPAHSDPAASVELGMNGWGKEIPKAQSAPLIKLATERTRVPKLGIAQGVIGAVTSAHAEGSLSELGVPRDLPLHETSRDQRLRLAEFAENAVEALVLLERGYDLYEGADAWRALVRVMHLLRSAESIRKAAEQVLALERLPSVQSLVLNGAITFEDVLRIRDLPETVAFRRWLWKEGAKGGTDIAQAYLAAMAPKVDVKQKGWFKTARLTIVNIVSTGVGAAVGVALGGPVGGVLGAAAGPVLSTAASVVVSAVDTFAVEKALEKENPRRFANDVLAPLAAKQVLAKVMSSADASKP